MHRRELGNASWVRLASLASLADAEGVAAFATTTKHGAVYVEALNAQGLATLGGHAVLLDLDAARARGFVPGLEAGR